MAVLYFYGTAYHFNGKREEDNMKKTAETTKMIQIKNIHPHPENPRKELGDLTELVDSIKKHGILQNLTVVPIEDQPGEYMSIIGHRRCAAAKLAGLTEVPCNIATNMDKKEQVTTMLEENMQRSDLSIYEQAQGFQMMLDLGETEDTLVKKTGFSKSTIRHRLNLAKLDQQELKEKSDDESFQLSLTDLYELEKIKDIQKRNEILKSAKNSRELACETQRAIKDIQRKEVEEKILELLKKAGVEEAPSKVKQEIYSSKWNTVKQYSLDEEPPKRLQLPAGETLYYIPYYYEIRVIKKTKKENVPLTEEEQKRKEQAANAKEIKARVKAMDQERKDFIEEIFSGKIKPVENPDEVMEKIWYLLLKMSAFLSASYVKRFFTGKADYDCTQEEKDDASEKFNKLSCAHQMLAMMHYAMEFSVGNLCDTYGNYNSHVGDRLLLGYDILKLYGWTYASSEDLQILDGTHPLYTVKENTEEEVAG